MSKMRFLLLINLLTINYVYSANVKVDPLVLINQGLVRGQKSVDGSYSKFLGVPYAAVDTTNPFGAAQAHPGFDGEVFNANVGSIQCPQSLMSSIPYRSITENKQELLKQGFVESLDCLRLNIYVPSQASSLNPLPVLVYIHGGIFSVGSAGLFEPHSLVKHDIVVVTLNYRLGPYGFMCLDTPTLPGNQGLKDQYEALRWIRNNIASFGGNPYNVTIYGQSAGAASALLHLYSNKDKLYHKVIVQSGTPQSYGLFVNPDYDAAVKLARYLGLNTTNNEQALNFLSGIPHELVTAAAGDLDLELRPCKEQSFSGVDSFINTNPASLSNEAKIRNTPILIGHTSIEVIDDLDIYGDAMYTDGFAYILRNIFNFNDEQLSEAESIVRHFYIGDKDLSKDVKLELENFDSDIVFNHPTHRIINNLLNENASPVYQYVFSYVGESGAAGAGHSTDLPYLFDISPNIVSIKPVINSDTDLLVAERMVTMWANFVKYGNPTPAETDLLPVIWQPVTIETRPYMNIDADIELKHRVYNDRMSFWDLFYVIYGQYSQLIDGE